MKYGQAYLLLTPNVKDPTLSDLIKIVAPSDHDFDDEKALAFARGQVQGWATIFPDVFLAVDKANHCNEVNNKDGFKNAQRV